MGYHGPSCRYFNIFNLKVLYRIISKGGTYLLEHVWQQTDGKTWHRGGIPCLQVEILHSTQDVVPILLSSGRISNAQHAHPQELVQSEIFGTRISKG